MMILIRSEARRAGSRRAGRETGQRIGRTRGNAMAISRSPPRSRHKMSRHRAVAGAYSGRSPEFRI